MRKHSILFITSLTLSISVLTLTRCKTEKIVEIKFPAPKFVHTSFHKHSLFLKWDVQTIPENKIVAYVLSYGIADGAIIKEQMRLSSHTRETGYTIENIDEGKEYWVRVQTIYSQFSGPWSEIVQGITGKPEPPINFTVRKNRKNAQLYLELTWDKNSANENLNITEYIVECWDTNDKDTASFKKTIREKQQRYKVSTKGEFATDERTRNTCSIQTKTDKNIVSDIVQSTATKFIGFTSKPTTKEELIIEIQIAMETEGNEVNLNYIDTSAITDMSNLFNNYKNAYELGKFNGDISN